MAHCWVPVGSGVGSYINLTNAMQCRATEYSLEKNIEVTVVHICIIYIYISNDPIQCKFRKFQELKKM